MITCTYNFWSNPAADQVTEAKAEYKKWQTFISYNRQHSMKVSRWERPDEKIQRIKRRNASKQISKIMTAVNVNKTYRPSSLVSVKP